MKNLRFILIAAFSLMLTTTSCKKEKQPEPAPAAQAPTATNTTLELSIVETDAGTSWSTPNIKIYDDAGNLVSTDTIPVNNSINMIDYPSSSSLCSIPGLTNHTITRPLSSAASFYRVEVYSGTTLVRNWKVTITNVVNLYGSPPLTVGDNICGYSPHKVLVLI